MYWCVCSLIFFLGGGDGHHHDVCVVWCFLLYMVFFIIWKSTYVILVTIRDSRWRRVFPVRRSGFFGLALNIYGSRAVLYSREPELG